MKVTTKLRPFTHALGTPILLPGKAIAVRVYPARLEIIGGEGIDLPVQGPIEKFTAIQDLERGGISVSFVSKQGFIRYRLLPGRAQPIVLSLKKGEIELPWQGEAAKVPLPEERLFLGSHKKLDWELVSRRKDPCELFPIWHRLGLALPAQEESKGPSLLENVSNLPDLMTLYSAGFYGVMVPSMKDPFHQGLSLPPVSGDNPYFLLSEGAKKIRALFFYEEKEALHLLPALPSAFHAGHFAEISTSFGKLSFEWSKHRLRTATLTATRSCSLILRLPKEVKQFRVRGAFLDAQRSFTVSRGEKLLLDRFMR